MVFLIFILYMLVVPLTFLDLFLEHHLDWFGVDATISQTLRTHTGSGISVYFSGVFLMLYNA